MLIFKFDVLEHLSTTIIQLQPPKSSVCCGLYEYTQKELWQKEVLPFYFTFHSEKKKKRIPIVIYLVTHLCFNSSLL